MKRINYLMLVALIGALSLPVAAQDEDFSRLYALEKDIKAIIPYYDAENHLSISHVTMDADLRFFRLTFDLEVGQEVQDADWYLNYIAHNDLWDISPVADYGFYLRLAVKLPKGKTKGEGTAAFHYSPADLRAVLAPPLPVQARTFIAGLARHMNSQLPHVTGEGETMVGCRYDDSARVMTFTYDYSADHWPEVRQYIVENMDYVRKDRAASLVMDTVNHLAFVSYTGEVALRHVYRNEQHTDSVEMVIVPWMWEMVFGQGAAGSGGKMQKVQVVADEIDRQCPSRVDSTTTLVSCRLDTVARTMTYRYEVSETMMQSLEKDKSVMQSLHRAVERAFLSQEGRRLAGYLKEAGVSVEYLYFSPLSKKPVSIVVPPERLAVGAN